MRNRWPRPSAPRGLRPGRQAAAVDRGPGRAPDTAHPGQAIGFAAAGRHDLACGLDLRWAKGQPLSRAATLASSSSRSGSISPSHALSRALLTSRRWEGVTPAVQSGCRHGQRPRALPSRKRSRASTGRPTGLVVERTSSGRHSKHQHSIVGKNAIAELAGT